MRTCLVIFILLVFSLSCVKEEGKISGGNIDTTPDGGETGSSTGGSTTGSPSTGSDPLASQAWHLHNTGQTAFSDSSGTPGEDINAKYVHETLDILGRGIRVAVSDSGTELDHPDLNDNALPTSEHRNYTFSSSAAWKGSSPHPSDGVSHGTSVTGLISAEGWNNLGSRGVAPSSKFAAFRYVFTPSAGEDTDSFLAKSIDQTYGNFDIFNYSYGRSGIVFFMEDPIFLEAMEVGANELRNGKGSIYVQSSGNSYIDYYLLFCADYTDPACYAFVAGNTNLHTELATPYKIVVGATNANGEASSYSTPGSSMWISAPGGEYGINSPAMITTDIMGCNAGNSYRDANQPLEFDFGFNSLNLQCDYSSRFNGTSSAAPVVSGVVALMLEANPELTWRDVKHILAVTADKIDYDPLLNTLNHPNAANPFGLGYVYDYKWVENASGFLYSNTYGFGRVDAAEAVEMALTYDLSLLGTYENTKSDEDVWYYDSGPLVGKTIPDENLSGVEDQIWVGHDFVIESVQISLTTDHEWPGDLAIHLVSPSGTESRVLNLNSMAYSEGLDPEFLMISNAFYGEESEGYWTIKIIDGDATGVGELLNWKILINGRRKTSDLSKPYPPTFMTLGIPGSLADSPVFAFSNSLTHASLLRYEAAVGDAPENENIKGWTNIGLSNSGQQLTGLTLISGETYYLKLRAVSPSGVSSVQLLSWTAP